MLALYKLQIKVLFKNPFLIFDFLFALIFILIFGSIIKINSQFPLLPNADREIMSQFFGFILSAIILNSGMYSFGFSFFSMKESVLLKRIGSTKISKSKAISAFILSGFTVLFLVILWMFFLSWILSISSVVPKIYYNKINYSSLIFGILIGAISSYTISFFFVSISKNSEIYNTLTTLYFFLAVFLGGGLNTNSQENPMWMEIISWLTPVGWISTFLSNSMLGANVWDFSGYIVPIFNTKVEVEAWEATLDVIMPIIFSILAILGSLKKFKWDS